MMSDCYECKFRRTVPGSAHSSCKVISEVCTDKAQAKGLEFLLAFGGKEILVNGKPAVDLDPHGIRNGWASWPIDFDPTWVRSCALYKKKNSENELNQQIVSDASGGTGV